MGTKKVGVGKLIGLCQQLVDASELGECGRRWKSFFTRINQQNRHALLVRFILLIVKSTSNIIPLVSMLRGWVPGCAELILRAYNLTIANEIEITIGNDKNVPGHARH
ncbi:hypothetical protein ES703_118610 [subsurface metagenome]